MSPASFSLGRSSSMTAALYCVAAFAVPPEVSVSAENCAPISSALMPACFETPASSPMTGMTSPTVVLPCFSMAKRRSEASAALFSSPVYPVMSEVSASTACACETPETLEAFDAVVSRSTAFAASVTPDE